MANSGDIYGGGAFGGGVSPGGTPGYSCDAGVDPSGVVRPGGGFGCMATAGGADLGGASGTDEVEGYTGGGGGGGGGDDEVCWIVCWAALTGAGGTDEGWG